MATFAPQLQNMPVPDWTKDSKPISQPEADKSKGLALTTLGEGITGVTQLAETGMEDYLKEKVHAGVDALRDTTTLAYEDVRKAQIQGTQPDPQAARTAGFTGKLTADSPEVPDGLQAGLDKASTLALAKAQGKANDTLYTGALNAMAKQLRAQYPGHRDFIDEQISKISGINPANAYMQNLLVDINRAGQGQDYFQKMILHEAQVHIGDPAVQKWLVATQQGLPNGFQGLTAAVLDAAKKKAQHQQWQIEHEEGQGNLADDATKAKNEYEIRSYQIAQEHMNPVVDIPGLTKPLMLSKLIQDSQEGKIALSPTQHDMLRSRLVDARRQAADHLDAVVNNEGYASRIRNPGEWQAIRDSKLAFFDRAIDAINNKDYGTFFELKRRNDAMLDQTKNQVNTSSIGEWTRQQSVFKERLGPEFINYLDAQSVKNGKLGDLQSFVRDSKDRASLSDDVRKDSVVKSLYNDLETAKRAKTQGAKAPDAIYDDLVNNVELILKANEMGRKDIAKEVVDYTFDPAKNSKIMDFFGKDFTDSNGTFHKGKFSAYDTLTQPRFVDAVDKVGDRESWNKFRNWNEMSFKKLFGERIQDLNTIQKAQNMPYKLTWDSDNSKMRVDFPTKPATAVEANYQNWIKDTLDNPRTGLNRGLQNLAYMHSKEGADTSEYLFSTLMELGYTPNDKIQGSLPVKVMNAIKASQEAQVPASERIKKAFERARGG